MNIIVLVIAFMSAAVASPVLAQHNIPNSHVIQQQQSIQTNQLRMLQNQYYQQQQIKRMQQQKEQEEEKNDVFN